MSFILSNVFPLLTDSRFAKTEATNCMSSVADGLNKRQARHPDLESPLDVWIRIAKQASWQNLADIRRTLSSADQVEKHTVFNIKANKYRLVTEISYRFQRVYIRHV